MIKELFSLYLVSGKSEKKKKAFTSIVLISTFHDWDGSDVAIYALDTFGF